MSEPAFKLIEFNARRAMRGVEAARLEVTQGGEPILLWMSKRDIKNNIKEFGDSPDLQKALTAYKAWA